MIYPYKIGVRRTSPVTLLLEIDTNKPTPVLVTLDLTQAKELHRDLERSINDNG